MRWALASLTVLMACSPQAAEFTAADEQAVRALEESYRTAWLANGSAAVMAVLAPDAVLMPAGIQPLRGDSAIRSYWWPSDGSNTTITSYRIDIEDVEGSAHLSFVRARSWRFRLLRAVTPEPKAPDRHQDPVCLSARGAPALDSTNRPMVPVRTVRSDYV